MMSAINSYHTILTNDGYNLINFLVINQKKKVPDLTVQSKTSDF
jgi:hypothetical protein